MREQKTDISKYFPLRWVPQNLSEHAVKKNKMWPIVPSQMVHVLFSVWSRVTTSCMSCREVALRLSCFRLWTRETAGASSPSPSPSRCVSCDVVFVFQLDSPRVSAACDGDVDPNKYSMFFFFFSVTVRWSVWRSCSWSAGCTFTSRAGSRPRRTASFTSLQRWQCSSYFLTFSVLFMAKNTKYHRWLCK